MSTDRPPFVVTRFPADDPKFPGCFAFRDDEEESMDEAFVVTEEAAHRLFTSLASALPEVRGYVVMSKGGSGEPLLAYLDLYRTRERAEHVAETLRDGAAYGLSADPEAHVGVVTALPDEA